MANEKINILVEAQDNASAPLKKVRGSIDQVGASAKKTAQTARGVTDSIGGVGRNAGQAGIQVQQFVGQLQGGVSPMVALSQQAADLGFVLGVPLVGAIVSIGAVVAGTLLPSLMEAEESFADLRKEAEGLGIGLTQLPSKLTEQNLLLLGTQAGQAGQKVQGLQKDLQKLKGDLIIAQAVGDSADEFGDLGTNVEATETAIAELETELAKANLQLDIANKNVMNFSDSLYEQYKRAQEAKNAITNYYDGIKAANVTDKDHLDGLRKKADALKAQIDPMFAYNQAVQEYERMAANNLITEKQLAEAKKVLRDRVLGVKDATDKMNLTMQNVRATGIRSLEDGLVGIITQTTSVKDAFRSMANAIIADLARMAIRKAITMPLAQSFGLTSFDGGGYTGSGGRSGGVDGKGGFPAILHPNETVVDHTKGQSMGGSPINVTLNISTGVAQTVRTEIQSMLPMITNATKAAIVDAKQRGGSFARAMA